MQNSGQNSHHQENYTNMSPDTGDQEISLDQDSDIDPPLEARKTRSGCSYFTQPSVTKHPSILKIIRTPKIPFLKCLEGISKYQLWANMRAVKDHNKLTGKSLKDHIFNELDYLTFDPKPVQLLLLLIQVFQN